MLNFEPWQKADKVIFSYISICLFFKTTCTLPFSWFYLTFAIVCWMGVHSTQILFDLLHAAVCLNELKRTIINSACQFWAVCLNELKRAIINSVRVEGSKRPFTVSATLKRSVLRRRANFYKMDPKSLSLDGDIMAVPDRYVITTQQLSRCWCLIWAEIKLHTTFDLDRTSFLNCHK